MKGREEVGKRIKKGKMTEGKGGRVGDQGGNGPKKMGRKRKEEKGTEGVKGRKREKNRQNTAIITKFWNFGTCLSTPICWAGPNWACDRIPIAYAFMPNFTSIGGLLSVLWVPHPILAPIGWTLAWMLTHPRQISTQRCRVAPVGIGGGEKPQNRPSNNVKHQTFSPLPTACEV